MSDAGKAVFLSYASQDAEAARRICEALRSEGVEVWFDADGGLEHGDEWDAKIRRQIKECVLFIPVISANTQAREEGYFRIEWDLAAERARGIASGVAFILPVVIDDTREPEALVPDRFRTVQWTKLPGGVVTPEVKARYLKLWSHRTGALKASEMEPGRPRPGERGEGAASPVQATTGRRVPVAAWIGVLLAVVALVGFIGLRPKSNPAADKGPTVAGKAAAVSPARQRAAQARALFENPNYTSDDLRLAEDLCKQATTLDSNDGEVWAVYAELSSELIGGGYDASPERREAARMQAERAVKLAPDSPEALFAKASFLRRQTGAEKQEAEALFRGLLSRLPGDPRVPIGLAKTIWGNVGIGRNLARADEALEFFDRAAAIPSGRAEALRERGFLLYMVERRAEAEASITESLALQPSRAAYMSRIRMACDAGNLPLAKEALGKLSPDVLRSDYGAGLAVQCWLWSREPGKCLEVLETITRDYLASNMAEGPTDYWRGLAYRLDGREQAAQSAWAAALKVVDRRLVDQPRNISLLTLRPYLLALLGQREAAATALKLAEELGVERADRGHYAFYAHVRLDPADQALSRLEALQEGETPAFWVGLLRLAPELDRIRDQPRFQELIRKLSSGAGPVAVSKAAEKSIAVLAFQNLGGDPDELFSEGISDEVGNVLAKVPGLSVAARTSAFYFKGKNVPVAEIAKTLHVAYIVEGTVQRVGSRVKIGAQLIKAADGFRLWGDSFTRESADAFAVEEEIAGIIARNLQLKLGDVPKVARTVNPEAHRLVLEGRHFWLLRTNEAFARAESAYTRALAIDPQFAEAHAGLANVYTVRGWYDNLEGKEVDVDFTRAREHAQRALALDPQMAEPWAALGALEFNQWRFAEAERAFQMALRLNPNYSYGHHWHAHLLMARGRLDEALAELDRAAQLDPLSLSTLVVYSLQLGLAGRNADALEMTDRALVFTPYVFAPLQASRAFSLLKVGRKEEALATARVVARDVTLKPRWWTDGLVITVLRETGHGPEAEELAAKLLGGMAATSRARSIILAALGQTNEALEEIQRVRPGASATGDFYYHDYAASLREDPRWRGILEKYGSTTEYETARATLARLQRERGAKP